MVMQNKGVLLINSPGSIQENPCPRTDPVITPDDVRSGKYSLEELVGQLTVEQMVDLCA